MKKIKCPDCEKESDSEEWKTKKIECKICGKHDVYVCPHCGVGYAFEHSRKTDV